MEFRQERAERRRRAFLILALLASAAMWFFGWRIMFGDEYRYVAMPTSWASPPSATAPPSEGAQLAATLKDASAQLCEYSDGRDQFLFAIAPTYRINGPQPTGPGCDYRSWNGEVAAAAHVDGGEAALFFFPAIPGLCPSNTAWAIASSAAGAWFQQATDVAHEAVHMGMDPKRQGTRNGIGPHAASAICMSPLDAFDVGTCRAHERGDPTTVMGSSSGRPTFREYLSIGYRDVSQRVTLGAGVSGRYTLEKLEQITGIQNLSVPGETSTYNFTVRTPTGYDAMWARTPRVTIHGYVDGYDAYIGYLETGGRFYSERDGLELAVVSVSMAGAIIDVRRFAPPRPTAGAPPTPTPDVVYPNPTSPPAECWTVPNYVRCTPTPAGGPAWTPTAIPSPTPTATSTPVQCQPSSTPLPPTCIPTTVPVVNAETPGTSPTAGVPSESSTSTPVPTIATPISSAPAGSGGKSDKTWLGILLAAIGVGLAAFFGRKAALKK
jgi:hypothetical protein